MINHGSGMVTDKAKKRVRFGTLGIVLGIMVVIVSIVWVAIINVCRHDQCGNEVTWVG